MTINRNRRTEGNIYIEHASARFLGHFVPLRTSLCAHLHMHIYVAYMHNHEQVCVVASRAIAHCRFVCAVCMYA